MRYAKMSGQKNISKFGETFHSLEVPKVTPSCKSRNALKVPVHVTRRSHVSGKIKSQHPMEKY